MEKTDINPMHLAKRCSARSKRTRQLCRAPAVKGWAVCRMHGAGCGAPVGKRNGRYRHGGRTKRTMAALMAVRAMTRLCRQTLQEI